MANRVTPVPKPKRPTHFIREWRKYRGLSQELLAERIGKTHGAISQLETGKTDYTQGMLEALAYALLCEPGDLLSVNPMMAGEVVDLTRLLRGASLDQQRQAISIVTALLGTGTGGRSVLLPQEDDDSEPDLGLAPMQGRAPSPLRARK